MGDPINLDLHSRYVTNPDMVLRIEDDDCGLLFDPVAGEVRVLNRPVVEIWNKLDGKRSLQELIADLGDVFDGMGPEAEAQILQAITSLIQIGAVSLSEHSW